MVISLSSDPLIDVKAASDRLNAWIEDQDFKGWDPFDALNSPLMKRLTFGNYRLGHVWVQLFKRSPINLRPLLKVPKGYNPKGLGLLLATYWRNYLSTKQPVHLERTNFLANWLLDNISPGYSGACWGYNFDWPNRANFIPAGTPTIVTTAFIGMAFLDIYHLAILGGNQVSDLAPNLRSTHFKTSLEVARSACEFVISDLKRYEHTDEFCFSYTPIDNQYIHNANMLGASLLAEVACQTNEAYLADIALAAARYTARRQLPNGAWKYGEGRIYPWVDNFHTGYVLVALKNLARALQTSEFDDQIHLGYQFWKKNFFLEDGAPKFYSNKVYPIDIHSAAQAILTFLQFSEIDYQAMESAMKVALWSIQNMQDAQGYFHYQIYPAYSNRIPYMRWSQAWILRALTELLWSQRGRNER
jgi:hypothetical protein